MHMGVPFGSWFKGKPPVFRHPKWVCVKGDQPIWADVPVGVKHPEKGTVPQKSMSKSASPCKDQWFSRYGVFSNVAMATTEAQNQPHWYSEKLGWGGVSAELKIGSRIKRVGTCTGKRKARREQILFGGGCPVGSLFCSESVPVL